MAISVLKDLLVDQRARASVNISDTWGPLLVVAVRDAVTYNDDLLRSETLRDRSDYEEHLLELTQFFEYVKAEYRKIEDTVGTPLSELLHERGDAAVIEPLHPAR
jgi:hypothetical protein